MHNYATTKCKRGHDRLVGGACIECTRERCRLYAAAHKEERAAYQREYQAKKISVPRLCQKGLHERKPGQRGGCGPCIKAAKDAARPVVCKNGHPREGAGRCKICASAYLREWNEKNADYAREYRDANREKRRKSSRKWRKKWRIENPDDARAQSRKEYARNPARCNAATMRWRRKWPDRWHARSQIAEMSAAAVARSAATDRTRNPSGKQSSQSSAGGASPALRDANSRKTTSFRSRAAAPIMPGIYKACASLATRVSAQIFPSAPNLACTTA